MKWIIRVVLMFLFIVLLIPVVHGSNQFRFKCEDGFEYVLKDGKLYVADRVFDCERKDGYVVCDRGYGYDVESWFYKGFVKKFIVIRERDKKVFYADTLPASACDYYESNLNMCLYWAGCEIK